ncbi:MAG TPA: PAS domain S-box protein, partial [Pyrinomonadaceae bacterium]|nr:PAS domain S-box protein [Pyrinomonadaceae bacterium]
METTGQQSFTKPLVWLVVGFAAGLLLLSVYTLPAAQLSIPYLLFILLTVGVGSRLLIEIPQGRAQVSATDAFVFLALLLFDAEAAIFLAAVAFLCASLYSHRQGSRRLLYTSLLVVSITLTAWTLRFFFGSIVDLARNDRSLPLVAAICIMALVQTVFVSLFVPLNAAQMAGEPEGRKRAGNFFWTFLAYLVGAAAAGLLAKLVGRVGAPTSIVVVTVLVLAYLIYLPFKKSALAASPRTRLDAGPPTKSEERFRSAFDYAAIGMALVSKTGRWLQVNHSLCQLLGYSERELLATDFQAITHPEDRDNAMAIIKGLLKGGAPSQQMEKRYLHKEGHPVWVLWSVSLAHEEQNGSAHLIFQIQDITDRKRAEQRLLHDVFHDALTGLPNRALFMDHLKLTVARAQRREDCMFAVLFLDLDRFK